MLLVGARFSTVTCTGTTTADATVENPQIAAMGKTISFFIQPPGNRACVSKTAAHGGGTFRLATGITPPRGVLFPMSADFGGEFVVA
jgi:hypothetical protein